MADLLQTILQNAALKNAQFPTTSRYYKIETTTTETAEGKSIIYLRRRFVPQAERFTLLQEHTVKQAERLDLLAAQYLGDPELFWQLCDANNAIRPEELIGIIGRKLRITLPAGTPGTQTR